MRSSAWRLAAWTSLWIGLHGCGHASAGGAAPAAVPPAPPAEIDLTLFLIGDAGAPAVPPDSEPVFMGLGALDTQWWLQEGPKPQHPASSCPADSEREVIDSVRAALGTAGARHVVVIAHHPLVSGGPHGGYFGWQDHVFPLRNFKSWLWIPLPLIGSVYPIARESGISRQDVSSATYRRMRAALDSAFAGSAPFIYAAGHDHALQVIGGTSARYELVSWAGTFGHHYRVTALHSTRFARSASGFMRVEFLRDGRARLGVIIVDRVGHAAEEFGLWLN